MGVNELQTEIDSYVEQGFAVVQEGRVIVLGVDAPKLAFSERVEGFNIGLLGTYSPPTWRSQFENRLLEDEQRWVHLRKPRSPGEGVD